MKYGACQAKQLAATIGRDLDGGTAPGPLVGAPPLETLQWYMKAAALSATVQGRDRVRFARANEETGLPEQS